MKKTRFLIVLILFSSYFSFAQERFTVNGETLELKTELNGTIDLLWNIIDKQYRYFVKKDGTITELINTKGTDNKFKEEYKNTLQQLTSDQSLDTKKVNLTLSSLRRFIDRYNTLVNTNYEPSKAEVSVIKQLSFFGGITNNILAFNPNNTSIPFIGAEFEVFTDNRFKNHTALVSLRHQFRQDDFDRSDTQFALGYRYRFINKPLFNIYGNVKLITYTYTDASISLDNSNNNLGEDISEGNIEIPFIFGLGADVRISPKTFITIIYNEVFAVFEDNSDNFPVDFGLGLKFIL